MSPEELRTMLTSLDDAAIYGEGGDVIEHNPGAEKA